MAFFEVEGKLVYLSRDKWKLIEDIVTKDKDVFYRAAAHIYGTKASKELMDLMHSYLLNQYKISPESFYKEFVYFKFENEDAITNLYPILDSYCVRYGYSTVHEYKSYDSPADILLEDMIGNAKTGYIVLRHQIKPYRRWWQSSNKTEGRILKLVIVPETVTKIEGELSNFVITTLNSSIHFIEHEILIHV